MNPDERSGPPGDEPESFEAAIARLEELVSELEAGDVPLEKSLAAFEEGRKLIAYCEQKLQLAEQVLKQLAGEAENSLGKDVLRGGQ